MMRRVTAESAEPYKEFIEQMVLRLERAGREAGRELAGMREDLRGVTSDVRGVTAGISELLVGHEVLREQSRALLRESRAMQAEISEAREETRAQTRALMLMIDRFDGGSE